MDKKDLVEIYKDTMHKSKTKYKDLPKYKSEMFSHSDERFDKIVYSAKYKTEIYVVNGLVLDVTEKLYLAGDSKIMVLNLASSFGPGGGVVRGAVAQEEDLFRKTNYYLSLDKEFYPIPKGCTIYTKSVYVIKDGLYNDLEKPFGVDMLAACAIKNPLVNSGYKYCAADFTIMNNVIENIFKTAYYNGNETLVLGALGCGAYHNPPMEVIKIFNRFLKKYNGCFKKIVFAVYSKYDKNYELFDSYIFKNEL
jgi:uncharacterized protein (TIGR02452 family)